LWAWETELVLELVSVPVSVSGTEKVPELEPAEVCC
jgi:hypothetical protein